MSMTGVGVSRLSLDLVVWLWLFGFGCSDLAVWIWLFGFGFFEQLLSKNPNRGRKDTPTPVIGIRRPGATLRRALHRTP